MNETNKTLVGVIGGLVIGGIAFAIHSGIELAKADLRAERAEQKASDYLAALSKLKTKNEDTLSEE